MIPASPGHRHRFTLFSQRFTHSARFGRLPSRTTNLAEGRRVEAMVAMAKARARNTGSFDHKTKCWRLRGRGIHATVRQLSERYGVEFRAETPAQLERETAPYWRRYMQDIEDQHRQSQRGTSP